MSKTISEKIVKFENRASQSSLRDLCYVLFRHKWRMILFFLAVIITVSVSILHSPEIYRSEAKLLVRLGRESVTLDPTVTTRQIINVSRSRESEVNLELEILKIRELSENVVDSIGPDAFNRRPAIKLSINRLDDPVNRKTIQEAPTEAQKSQGSPKVGNLAKSSDDRNKALLKVMKNLEIQALKDSGIINISYEANTPKLAQNVINALINSYLEKHITVHQTPGSHQFFLQQVNGLRNTLAQSENELRNLRDKCGISSIEEQQQVILSRIAELEGQTGAAEAELAACEAKVQALQKTLANIPEVLVTQETSGFSDHAIDLMRAKLYELQLKEHESLSKFAEGSQQVHMIRQEITEARMLLDKEIAKAGRIEVSKGVNIAYIQIQSALTTERAALSSFRAKVENLRKQLVIAKEGLKGLNDADLKITSLKREISLQQANYQKYSENLEQARIDHALEAEKISNISVVQPATLPTRPVPQRKLLKLALGLLVGILGAIALAFFFEYIDHSIRTPDQAEEKLSLPILASIPCVRGNRIRPTGKRRKKQAEHNKTGTNSKAIQGSIFGKFKEHCIFCRNALFKQRKQIKTIDKSVKSIPTLWKIPEKIRGHYSIFREELLLKVNGHSKAPFSLALIGCRRGEGVSTVAANISAMLAQLSNGRVLLVDANIYYPSAHRIFKTRLGPGLVDILSASHDYGDKIVSWRFRNLHILTAGSPNGTPGILRPSQFNAMINSLKKDYHYVVLDMPALGESRSAARLASLCDGVVLVVEAGSQRWEILCKAKEQLLKYNANTLGVVLNKRKFPIPEWLYQTL